MPSSFLFKPTSTGLVTGWRDETGATVASNSTTAIAKVTDGSDATYFTDTLATTGGAYPTITATFAGASPNLPGGSLVTQVNPVIRASQAIIDRTLRGKCSSVVNTPQGQAYTWQCPDLLFNPTAAIKDFTMASGPAIPWWAGGNSQANAVDANTVLKAMTLVAELPAQNTSDDHRVYQLSALVSYIQPPAASNLQPVNANDLLITKRPQFKWDYSSTEAYPQYQYRAAVWSQADAAAYPGGLAAFEAAADSIFAAAPGADPSLGPSFPDGAGGYKYAKAWSVSDDGANPGWATSNAQKWLPAQELANGTYYAYVQVSYQYQGTRVNGEGSNLGIAKYSFTMNVTPLSAPTSVTPVWQYPGAAAPNKNSQYRTKVDVAYPAQSLGTTFTARRVYVERKLSGSANGWVVLPRGVKDAAGTGAGTLTFYDTYTSPGSSHQYRAKVELYNPATGLAASSSYVTSGTTITALFDQFVLRNPLDESGAVVLSIQGDLEGTRREAQGSYEALGSTVPQIVSDQLRGWEFPIKATLPDANATYALGQLRSAFAPLLLQGDGGGWYYWVRFGPDYTATILRQALRQTKRVEVHEFTLRQCAPIVNQPSFLPFS